MLFFFFFPVVPYAKILKSFSMSVLIMQYLWITTNSGSDSIRICEAFSTGPHRQLHWKLISVKNSGVCLREEICPRKHWVEVLLFSNDHFVEIRAKYLGLIVNVTFTV